MLIEIKNQGGVPVLSNITEDNDYFDALGMQESGGGKYMDAPTSTAHGKYQFTQGTWADLMRRHPEAGLTPAGIKDNAQQERAVRILTLDNANELGKAGVIPSPKNLYMAHFLGAGGAKRFFGGLAANPNAPATAFVDPRAAAANRSVFFKGNKPRTLAEVYELQGRRFGGNQTMTAATAADTPPEPMIEAGTPALGAETEAAAAEPSTSKAALMSLMQKAFGGGQAQQQEPLLQSVAPAPIDLFARARSFG